MTELIKFHENNGKLRVRDVDLGRFLGMERPTNIRQTIAKYLKEKKLNDSDVITQRVHVKVGNLQKPVDEYLLTEGAALFVGARSDTPNGPKLMHELVAVFEEWRKQSGAVSRLLSHYFADAPAKLKDRPFRSLIRLLLKLRSRDPSKKGIDSGTENPAWGPSLGSWIYEWSIKAHGQQKHRREINPNPTGSNTDYRWLTSDGWEACKQVIQTGEAFARALDSWEEWKYRMELAFGSKTIQLHLATPVHPKQLGKGRKRNQENQPSP